MKTLLLMRHAKSSWNSAALSDYERPLNERGKRDAPRMGRRLRQEDLLPQLILCSGAERALATAEAVALSAGYEGEIIATRRLYGADPETYLALVAEKAGQREIDNVLVVGHNPDLEELIALYSDVPERMATANVARIDLLLNRWEALTPDTEGTLSALWRPREDGLL